MPVPEETGACIKHFMEKGRPRKQAIAICLQMERDRKRHVAKEASRRVMKKEKS